MSMKHPVHCNCGQRILARDVLSTGYELRRAGPNYIYVKFCCPRCRRLGEHLVEQSQWDWDLLRPQPAAAHSFERRASRMQAPITYEEMIDFHFALEAPDALKYLK